MKFSKLMLQKFQDYKLVVYAFEHGLATAVDFLTAHKDWNDAVEAFERECSSSSNFGAF